MMSRALNRKDGLRVKPSPPSKDTTVAKLLRERLKETEKTVQELADTVDVPKEYIDDLIAGRRRPPRPGRTDIYDRMTSFLGLSRNDLANCARTEREATAPKRVAGPKPTVRRQLLELCEPDTAKKLEQRRAKNGGAELADYVRRLLDITQSAVQRMLIDKMTLRLSAKASASSYAAMRLEVLEFLDTTPDTLTITHLVKFLQPRVAFWDVDLQANVLRVVMHSQIPGDNAARPARAAY